MMRPSERRRTRRAVGLVLALAMLATACSDEGDEPDDDAAPATSAPIERDASGDLRTRLSTGDAPATEPEPAPVVEGDPLGEDRIADVLATLPEWTGGDAEAEDFNRPAESLRPPRTGETIAAPFPADEPEPPPEVEEGPLEVLRHQPEGDVAVAPFVSITFDQPMVPLTTLSQLDATDPPATISPELPGRWQWIGTRTLRFEHSSELIDRLPMATEYTVEVPAGTTSESGGELAEAVSFTFATPPVKAVGIAPEGESLPLDQVFVATFDQRVDAESMLEAIAMVADGDDRDLRLATDDEIAADEDVAALIEQAPEGRFVAFRAEDELEADSDLIITVGPDAPSAEGPLTSDATHRVEARTYAPLAVDQLSCRGLDVCYPGRSLTTTFNNALDPDAFDPALVTVTPELAGAFVALQPDRTVEVRGDTKAGVTYEVTFDGELRDVYGQTLGDDETVRFTIAAARPELGRLDRELLTLDPLADVPALPIQVVNHDGLRVRAYRVDPTADWTTFRERFRQMQESNEGGLPPLPWSRVMDETVATDAAPNERTEVMIELADALGGATGHLVVTVEPVGALANLPRTSQDYWQNRPILVWVQATHLAADAIIDHDEAMLWATDLTSGAPIAGVDVRLDTGAAATTNAEGLATVPLPTDPSTSVEWVLATRGDDAALLMTDHLTAQPRADSALWHVMDDRGTYRPGETVRLKGWVRKRLATDAQLGLYGDSKVSFGVRDTANAALAEGTVEVDALGGFDLSFELPAGANLGGAQIALTLHHADGVQLFQHTVQIQEFRRPEFEVTTEVVTPAPHLIDRSASVAVDASYYAGGALPDAPVSWTVRTKPTTYAPPGWDDFHFGIWRPVWIDRCWECGGDIGFRGDSFGPSPYPPYEEPEQIETFSATTDAAGRHVLDIAVDGDIDGQPTAVVAEATVTDVNRQGWSARSDLLVHPAQRYVGLRSARSFVEAGEDLVVEAIVTDLDGEAVADAAVAITSSRMEEQFVDGEWTDVAVDTETCEVTSAAEAVECRFDTDAGGQFEISATVTDDGGRSSRSELQLWASGGTTVPSRTVELEEATLVPDAEEHQPGDTAEILVQSPWRTGSGLATIERGGVLSTQTFAVEDFTAVVRVPITVEHIGGVHVQVDLAGVAERTADDGTPLPDAAARPAYASGQVALAVPPTERTLTVDAAPRDATIEPGGSTTIDVAVTDAGGEPVAGAELVVVVVDEAVLALSAYELADPTATFYGELPPELRALYARALVRLVDPSRADGEDGEKVPTSTIVPGAPSPLPLTGPGDDADFAEGAAVSNDSGAFRARAGGDEVGPQIQERTSFDALAVFEPEATTGADGTTTVDVELPDSLTRYRVMAVAVDGVDRFGSGESALTARLPLMARPSAPRFLTFGDTFELPVVVQNQTDESVEVDVVVESSNLTLTDGVGQRVTVPANDRVEVRFPAETDEVGTASFRAVAYGDGNGDAAVVSLPVYTPATAEAFATYGVVDDGAIVQGLQSPEGVFPQFGGLEVSTSSTAVQALTDAVLYIHEYDFESADAHAGRILTVAALRDVLEAFDAEGLPPAAELNAGVAVDIAGLARLQFVDGGFLGWRTGHESIPFTSIQAMHALVVAEERGYSVPSATVARGLDYLRIIEDRYPPEWSQEVRDTHTAYALHVRMLAGERDPAAAKALYDRAGEELELDALAWLWPVLDDEAASAEILRTFENRATDTAGAATFATDYGDDAYLLLHSDRRTDGIILDALIAEVPDSDLIPKVVAGLLANQTRGRWDNIQENTFILLALHRYFETFEAVTPDFIARIWLGDLYAGEHEYRGRTTEEGLTRVPMAELLEAGDDDLIVSKDGAGRLYYRLGLRYAPTDLRLDPLDRGFVVARTYEGVDDPDDVRQDDEGRWHVRAGAQVRVTLTMVADSRRTHVMLLDPLAAGTEPLNPALAVTATPLPPDGEEPPPGMPIPYEDDMGFTDGPRYPIFPWGPWYEHDALRDDRAEAYTSLLSAGTYEYSYLAKATTPGRFVVPPARAEELYAPETFGRSGTDILIVDAG